MGEGEADLTDLRFVGPATAAVLRAADVSVTDVRERYVDHETLVEAGVNPGVAARIRREHSLAWSHSTGGDLSRRAEQVGGLGEGERAWVTASAGDWTAAETERARLEPESERGAESEWRERSAPTPVTDLPGVDDAAARRLAEAGVTSVRALAVADASRVADSLDLDPETVAAWQGEAREHRGDV